MKLIIFTNTYPYRIGESFLEEEIPVLVNYFNDITVVPLYNGNRELRQMPAGVKLAEPLIDFSPKNRLRLLKSGLLNLSPIGEVSDYYFSKGIFSRKKIWAFHTFLLLRRVMLASLQKFISNTGIVREDDILFYFYWGDKSVMILPELKKKFPFSKAVVRFHGADLYEEVPGIIPFRKRIFSCIDLAVTISEKGKEYMESRYGGYLPKRIEVSHLGVRDYKFNYMFESSKPEVELSPFDPGNDMDSIDEKVFHIVSCSDLIPLKRVDMIMDALSVITEDELTVLGWDRIEWIHMGEGELKHQLVSRAEELAAGPDMSHVRMVFKGAMRHAEVMSFYKENRQDLFVQTSSSEGIPVSIMEALSFEIPVIATDVGGVSEIVEKSFGILLPENPTVADVKNAILSMMAKDAAEIEEMRRNARRSYEEKWDSDKNYNSFAAILLGIG